VQTCSVQQHMSTDSAHIALTFGARRAKVTPPLQMKTGFVASLSLKATHKATIRPWRIISKRMAHLLDAFREFFALLLIAVH
jgi:hypothetical protein